MNIATQTGTGFYRAIIIVWNPEGCEVDPMKGGNTMEQSTEREFGEEIGFVGALLHFRSLERYPRCIQVARVNIESCSVFGKFR